MLMLLRKKLTKVPGNLRIEAGAVHDFQDTPPESADFIIKPN